MPSCVAALATTPLASRRARRIASLSVPARVRVFAVVRGGGGTELRNSVSGTFNTGPGDRITALSMMFSNSRTFPGQCQLPLTESLRDTVVRLLPCWQEQIAPAVQSGKQVLIAAHGNSLRALVKHLDGIPDQKIVEVEIPTGVPLVFELDDNLKPLCHYYLGDPKRMIGNG